MVEKVLRVLRVLRVLKFDGPFGPEGCGIAFGDEYEVSVTGFPSRPTRHSERGEESRYAKHMREMLLNTSQREGAAGCKEEGNRLPASCCRLVPAGCLWIHQQELHYGD